MITIQSDRGTWPYDVAATGRQARCERHAMEITMSDRSSPRVHCSLYRPGHNIHWIQLRLTWNEPVHDPIPAQLIDVRDDGAFTLVVDGEHRRYWNHEPERMARAMARFDGEFELVGYGVLLLARQHRRVGEPSPAFCIVEPDSAQRVPCFDSADWDEDDADDPIKQIKRLGGFTMSFDALLEWLEREDP